MPDRLLARVFPWTSSAVPGADAAGLRSPGLAVAALGRDAVLVFGAVVVVVTPRPAAGDLKRPHVLLARAGHRSGVKPSELSSKWISRESRTFSAPISPSVGLLMPQSFCTSSV